MLERRGWRLSRAEGSAAVASGEGVGLCKIRGFSVVWEQCLLLHVRNVERAYA